MDLAKRYQRLDDTRVFGGLPKEELDDMRQVLVSGLISGLKNPNSATAQKAQRLVIEALKHDAAVDKDMDARGRLDEGRPTEIVQFDEAMRQVDDVLGKIESE